MDWKGVDHYQLDIHRLFTIMLLQFWISTASPRYTRLCTTPIQLSNGTFEFTLLYLQQVWLTLSQWTVRLHFYLARLGFFLFSCVWDGFFCFSGFWWVFMVCFCFLEGYWFFSLQSVGFLQPLCFFQVKLTCAVFKIICLSTIAWVQVKLDQHAFINQHSNKRKKNVL